MKALKETMLSLVGGAGLLVFMGGLIGGISVLLPIRWFIYSGRGNGSPFRRHLHWSG
jgi:hypothetical protein